MSYYAQRYIPYTALRAFALSTSSLFASATQRPELAGKAGISRLNAIITRTYYL